MSERFIKEVEAYGLLQKLLEQADEVRRCFISAGLPLPGPLIRLLGKGELAPKTEQISTKKNIIDTPSNRPEAAEDDWIAIKLEDLTPQDLVLAFLRDASWSSLSPKEIIKQVNETKPETQSGTIYNIGPRLINQKIMEKNDEGEWFLIDPIKAPLIEGDYAWGPPSVFCQPSLAAKRRKQIVRMLTESPDGLTTMQITKILRSEGEGVKVSKEVTMADMKVLHNKGIVKRSGKHKKWSIDDRVKE